MKSAKKWVEKLEKKIDRQIASSVAQQSETVTAKNWWMKSIFSNAGFRRRPYIPTEILTNPTLNCDTDCYFSGNAKFE